MIYLKSDEQIEAMKKAGRLSAKALRMTGELVRPGISTLELDEYCERIIRMGGGVPAFKGYGGFPGTICASVNKQVVHGIPSANVILQEGDIISIDTGAIVDGWVGDNAWTYAVGEIDPEVQRLLDVTEESMWKGLEQVVAGNHIGDIGYAVQHVAESAGFGVVREYVGHGIGHNMHEDPNVPNFGHKGRGSKIKVGEVLCVEPMITLGSHKVAQLSDGWTVVTVDGKPAAHFEKQIAVTSNGPVIITQE